MTMQKCFFILAVLILSVAVCAGNVSAAEDQTVIDVYAKSNVVLPPGMHQSSIDSNTVTFQTSHGEVTFTFADDSLQGYQITLIEVTASDQDARKWMSDLLQTDQFLSYNVQFKDPNGNDINIAREYTVTLSLPSEYEDAVLVGIDSNGKVQSAETVYKDGKLTFTKTADMTYFAVKKTAEDTVPPKTGHESNTVALTVIVMLSLATLLWAVPKKKHAGKQRV